MLLDTVTNKLRSMFTPASLIKKYKWWTFEADIRLVTFLPKNVFMCDMTNISLMLFKNLLYDGINYWPLLFVRQM